MFCCVRLYGHAISLLLLSLHTRDINFRAEQRPKLY